MNSKLIRKKFRSEVFLRDKYVCRNCCYQSNFDKCEVELDAHHITPREKMPNGGYVKDNGISLCKNKCHLMAEKFLINGENPELNPNNLYKLINSSYQLAFKKSGEIYKTRNESK